MFNKLAWYVKQILPLKYKTVYKKNDVWHFTEWRMFFGRCFFVKDIKLDS